ncbi:cation:proton antiporter [Celerinatantimonas sp. YJH-8]|uniref:cation:proton antiporter domain-containing protein n=1 Tax=Celerinatantimonas sp. YJH-8 TaxID=3228714 RepID=UPI0038BEC90A
MNAMDAAILLAVTACAGLLLQLIKLPPLLGFLLAGFILNYLGIQQSVMIDNFANLGVTLLLFSIGLKLDIRTLLKTEVYASSLIHLGLNGCIFIVFIFAFKLFAIPELTQLSTAGILLLAFSLSFSSTVFAVKVLQDKSELHSFYGRVAIGILVMQDIFAVIFLSFSSGISPSIWALSLILLIPLRPILLYLIQRAGHGEVQLLIGFSLTFLLGYYWFGLVGIKPDLGALLIGMLIAGTNQANNLSRALFAFKELFLVAFFLSIGMHDLPTSQSLIIALLLVCLLPIKGLLYLALLLVFRLRARTAWFGSLSLTNYSEFGLIVCAVAVQHNWLSGQWLAGLAITLSLSFLIAAPLNQFADPLYRHWLPILQRLQRKRLSREDMPIELGNMEVVILGMGRIGTGAYDHLSQYYPDKIIGVDTDLIKVQNHIGAGRAVIQGDAADSDFWEKLIPSQTVQLILLTMPHHNGNVYAVTQLRKRHYAGKIAAISHFDEDYQNLKELGVDEVVNLYDEAGLGFAQHIYGTLYNSDNNV